MIKCFFQRHTSGCDDVGEANESFQVRQLGFLSFKKGTLFACMSQFKKRRTTTETFKNAFEHSIEMLLPCVNCSHCGNKHWTGFFIDLTIDGAIKMGNY